MNGTQVAPRTSAGSTSGDQKRQVGAGAAAAASTRPHVFDLVGGMRGAVDGGLPPLVFVAVNAIAGAHAPRSTALAAAISVAVATGLAILVLRLVRRETLKQALAGLAGLTVAVVFAARSGEARGFFLPAIYVDAAYAVVFAASAAIGRPLVGIIHGLLYGRRGQWRTDARLRRTFMIATAGWALVFAIRAGVQAFLYGEDHPGLLAVGKLLLGWPLTIVALLLTLAYLRRVTAGRTDASPES
jgi:hypothetical protein